MRALRWLCPAAADRGIGKNPKGGTHTQISPPSTPLVHLCELQPTGCVVGTFGGGKRPVHPSLPQAVVIEYLPVPALGLGSAPINPKDFKATLFWDLPVVAARMAGFKDSRAEASSFVTCCRDRHIGTFLITGLFGTNGRLMGGAGHCSGRPWPLCLFCDTPTTIR